MDPKRCNGTAGISTFQIPPHVDLDLLLLLPLLLLPFLPFFFFFFFFFCFFCFFYFVFLMFVFGTSRMSNDNFSSPDILLSCASRFRDKCLPAGRRCCRGAAVQEGGECVRNFLLQFRLIGIS